MTDTETMRTLADRVAVLEAKLAAVEGDDPLRPAAQPVMYPGFASYRARVRALERDREKRGE